MMLIFAFAFGLLIGSFLNVVIVAPSRRPFHRHSAVPLPPLQEADKILRQHSASSVFCCFGENAGSAESPSPGAIRSSN